MNPKWKLLDNKIQKKCKFKKINNRNEEYNLRTRKKLNKKRN